MRVTVHNCYVEVFGRKPTEAEITKLISNMPGDIWEISEEFGDDDIVFKDLFCNWLKDNK